jgi:hypothetical protein
MFPSTDSLKGNSAGNHGVSNQIWWVPAILSEKKLGFRINRSTIIQFLSEGVKYVKCEYVKGI